jgi:translation initiation factor 2B subunit (eIF-2B alpha/beta/delta family)
VILPLPIQDRIDAIRSNRTSGAAELAAQAAARLLVAAQPAPNVTVVNYYFDLTPLDHLAGIVTEEGISSRPPGPGNYP